MLNAKDEFNLLGDGSDETAKLLTALNSGGDKVYFPAGIYGFSGKLAMLTRTDFMGAGREKTIFKNLGTGNGIAFERGSDGQATAFLKASDFTLDMNGVATWGMYVGCNFTSLDSITIKNTGAGSSAMWVDRATLSRFSNILLYKNAGGLYLGQDTFYTKWYDLVIESKGTGGVSLSLVGCVDTQFHGLYLDPDGANTQDRMMLIHGCDTTRIWGLAAEMSSPISANAIVSIENSRETLIQGIRINHHNTQSGLSIFKGSNSHGITIRNGVHFEQGGGSNTWFSQSGCSNVDVPAPN